MGVDEVDSALDRCLGAHDDLAADNPEEDDPWQEVGTASADTGRVCQGCIV